MSIMNYLLVHKDRDVSSYVALHRVPVEPVLRKSLRKLGEEEQVNICGEEKESNVGSEL